MNTINIALRAFPGYYLFTGPVTNLWRSISCLQMTPISQINLGNRLNTFKDNFP